MTSATRVFSQEKVKKSRQSSMKRSLNLLHSLPHLRTGLRSVLENPNLSDKSQNLK